MSSYIQFGSGLLYLNPNAGNLATNPTPTKGLTIQDITVDMAGDIKELRGQSQFPDDTAKGDIKGTFKFAMGRKDFNMISQVFLGDTVAVGGNSVSPNEDHAIPTTPFTVTVTPPSSGTFLTDLGVSFVVTGKELTKLPSGTPATGQYTVNTSTGAYLFAAADTGLHVLISYAYAGTTGATYQVNNQPLGYGPQFEAFIVDQYQPVSGIYSVVHLYAAKIAKVNIVNKRDGYAMPEMEGSYFNSPSNRVIDYYSNVG